MVFEPGINCIVGPNGSGKSNVVDALAWVMGEQGAKNLRGAQMADIIFAGTPTRPALGRAEVSLTIDNSDGALPIEYSEVSISRTIFRSGGSEYAINGTPARLLDIQELLSDTGMGRQMHVIIGQGKLDEVLQATPEDRRAFVEEAAGVLKHRRRKERALRKLEAMGQNLTRVEDLARELSRQLGPLERQAKAARKARTVQEEVRDATARLLADSLAQEQARLQSGYANLAGIEEEKREYAGRLAALKTQREALEAERQQADPRLARYREQSEALALLEEKFRSLQQVASERERSLRSQAPALFERGHPQELRERAQRAADEEALLQLKLDQARDELTREEDRVRELTGQHTKADMRARELADLVAKGREEQARWEGRYQAALQAIQTSEAEAQRLDAAWQAAQENYEQAVAQCRKVEEDLALMPEDVDRPGEDEGFEAARTQRDEARSVYHRLREQLQASKARADALAQAHGQDEASTWVREHYDGATLGDYLVVDPRWESAIEAGLDLVEGVLLSSFTQVSEALSQARERSLGYVTTFVPADVAQADVLQKSTRIEDEARNRATAATLRERIASWESTQVALACDVVSLAEGGPAGAQEILRRELAGVVLCDDAEKIPELLALGARTVLTSEGDRYTPMSGRGGVSPRVLRLQTARALREEHERTASLEGECAQASQALARCEEAYTAQRKEADALQAAASRLKADRAAKEAQLGVLRRQIATSKAEMVRFARHRDSAREREEKACVSLEVLKERTVASTAQEDHQALEDARAALAEVAGKLHKARKDETAARLAVRSREERLRSIAGKSERLLRQADAITARMDREKREAARRERLAEQAGQIAQACARAVTVLAGYLECHRLAAQSEEEAAAQAREQMRTLSKEIEGVRSRLATLEDSGHQLALERERLLERIASLEARSRESIGLDGPALIEQFGPHLPVPHGEGSVPYVRAEQEKRLEDAQRALKRLGKINPLALEEYAALEERHRYVQSQLEDVKKSREDLLTLIKDLDAQLHTVLVSALEDVAAQFTSTFARLFPGGHGELVFTDPESPLTTGIDIHARPPGKKVKRLSLLSGGERSLTAIAFLVAIFKARPSPFYVMDEVEAALDDTNLTRLLGLFQELQHSSQLLIITHQKRTMEIADTLYGITMAEEGVTSVISQKMAQLREG